MAKHAKVPMVGEKKPLKMMYNPSIHFILFDIFSPKIDCPFSRNWKKIEVGGQISERQKRKWTENFSRHEIKFRLARLQWWNRLNLTSLPRSVVNVFKFMVNWRFEYLMESCPIPAKIDVGGIPWNVLDSV